MSRLGLTGAQGLILAGVALFVIVIFAYSQGSSAPENPTATTIPPTSTTAGNTDYDTYAAWTANRCPGAKSMTERSA